MRRNRVTYSDPSEVVLFDFDGVVRHWSGAVNDAMDRRLGLQPGTFVATTYEVAEYELGVLGRVTFDDWCTAITTALAQVAPAADVAGAVTQWRRYRGDVDRAMVHVVEEARSVAPVGLVSNAHDCLRADLRELGVEGLFDHVICSAAIGVAKPSREIYLAAADAFSVPPARCAFVDDQLDNVRTARDLGMRSDLFRGPAECQTFLRTALQTTRSP